MWWRACHSPRFNKMADYKAWFEARNKRFEELCMPTFELYEVQCRTNNVVCVVTPVMTPEEWEAFAAKYRADDLIPKLAGERNENRVVVEGTTETFLLTKA